MSIMTCILSTLQFQKNTIFEFGENSLFYSLWHVVGEWMNEWLGEKSEWWEGYFIYIRVILVKKSMTDHEM